LINNLFSLEGKNIIITGSSSGIGRQCAISCSKMGANIVLIGRDENKINYTLKEMTPGRHIYYIQDIREYEKIENIVSDSVQKLGKVSGFVHSAGIEMTVPINSMNPKRFEELFSINVISGFEFARIISKNKNLENNNGASFVFISSVMGFLGKKGNIGYCSTKGSLISGIKAMALELSEKKIRVNCISPSYVKTPMLFSFFENASEEAKNKIINMHPLGLGEPNDVANACIFLLSNASKWITGTNLIVDGGYSAQ
jgi:NAD(P)-dependent dehydrogenase (short-subunit alcohol dehydrogenase family)